MRQQRLIIRTFHAVSYAPFFEPSKSQRSVLYRQGIFCRKPITLPAFGCHKRMYMYSRTGLILLHKPSPPMLGRKFKILHHVVGSGPFVWTC